MKLSLTVPKNVTLAFSYKNKTYKRFTADYAMTASCGDCIHSRDVKSSRPSRPRGQICWPQPRPCSTCPRPRATVASFS